MSEKPPSRSEEELLRLWFRRGMMTGHATLMINRVQEQLAQGGGEWNSTRIRVILLYL